MNLQDEYANAQPSAPQTGGGDQDNDGDMQDLTIPADQVSQIAQAIQQQDCDTLMKLMTQALSQQPNAGDQDNDQM